MAAADWTVLHSRSLTDLALQRHMLETGFTEMGGMFHSAAMVTNVGRVEDDALAIAHAAESGLEAEQLQSVDRLASFADQQAEVVLPGDHRLDPVVVLANLNLTVKVKLVQNPLNQLPNPLSRLLGPFRLITHAPNPIPARVARGGRVSPFWCLCSLR